MTSSESRRLELWNSVFTRPFVKTILSITIALFVAAPVLLAQQAGDGAAGRSSDRFSWSWEEGTTEPSSQAGTPTMSAGIGAAAYDSAVNENLQLRREIEELRRSRDEVQKISADLVARIKSLESASAKPETGGAAGAGTNSADMTRTLEENLALQTEVARLRSEVEVFQESQGSSTALVTKDSDLFKRVLQDNTALRAQLQKMKEAQKEAADSRKALADAEARSAARDRDRKSRVAGLEKQNSDLKKTVLKLEEKARELKKTADEVPLLRADVKQKGKLLAEQAAALKKMESDKAYRKDKAARATEEAGASTRDKIDVMFNMGVLYIKTGMYAEAEKQLLGVLKADPAAADAHYNLGILYDKHLSDRKKAVYHYKKCLDLDPANADAEKIKLWILEIEMK